MTTPVQPRFDYVDLAWATELRDRDAQELNLPAAPSQVDYYLHADRCYEIALIDYALGARIDDVRQMLGRAAAANLKVFELRGTVPGIDVTIKGESRRESVDYSLTNSRRGLLAICQAEASGNHSVAVQIAALVGDPPGANYIGPDSEVCTPADQQLAYSVRSLIAGNDAEALDRLRGFSGDSLEHLGAMVRSLASREPAEFSDALFEHLAERSRESRDPANRYNPELYLRTRALGLSALAIREGILAAAALPGGHPYFPVELLTGAGPGKEAPDVR